MNYAYCRTKVSFNRKKNDKFLLICPCFKFS